MAADIGPFRFDTFDADDFAIMLGNAALIDYSITLPLSRHARSEKQKLPTASLQRRELVDFLEL